MSVTMVVPLLLQLAERGPPQPVQLDGILLALFVRHYIDIYSVCGEEGRG